MHEYLVFVWRMCRLLDDGGFVLFFGELCLSGCFCCFFLQVLPLFGDKIGFLDIFLYLRTM